MYKILFSSEVHVLTVL